MSEAFHDEEYDESFNGKTILRILKVAWESRWLFLGFVAAVIVVSVLESYGTYVTKRIIDEGMIPGDAQRTFSLLLRFGVVMLGQAAAVFGFIVCAGLMGDALMYLLRKRVFAKLQDLSFAYFDRTAVGWIMSRTNSDTTKIADFATWMLLDLFWATANIVSALVFMSMIDAPLALIVGCTLPPLVFIAVKFKKLIIKEFRQVRSTNSKITASYNESITGVRVVKALAKENENLAKFSGITGDMYRHSFRAAWLSALFLPVVQIVTSVALGAVIWYGGWRLELGGISVGGIKAFVSYIGFIMWPISDLARVYSEMQHAVAGAERVFSLLDQKCDIVDRPDAVPFERLETAVEFKGVAFHYDPASPVLQDFSLKIAKGETVALVGPTGGGKSTIANLAARFYEPVAGEVLVDGVDYRAFKLQTWQSKLGVVLQTPHLFSGTVLENLRYGRLEATDEECFAAARLAHAEEFILKLEGGYAAPVGEGGALLSVGQKQLLGIARALLAEPEFVIFDEATSSIDTVTEDLIQKGMKALLSRSAGLVVAHRLSTIRDATRIVVIEGGRIVEQGTHRELLVAGGHYRELYTSQFRSEREDEEKLFA
jgi:ATP-binding cassette subfamily B protein